MVVQGLAWLELMDERGSGIPRMKRLLEQAGHPAPLYRDDHDSLVLELRPADHRDTKSTRERASGMVTADPQDQTPREAILAEAEESGTITTKICVQRLGIPSATAKRHLAELVEAGILEREGAARGTYYRLTEPI